MRIVLTLLGNNILEIKDLYETSFISCLTIVVSSINSYTVLLYFRQTDTEIVCHTQSCETCVLAFEGENLEITQCRYSGDIVVAIDGAAYQSLEYMTFCYMRNPEIILPPSRNSTMMRYVYIQIVFKMEKGTL